MDGLRVLNLGVRFALELGALAAFGYWAATLPASGAIRAIAAVVTVVAVAVFWGAFVSPKARFPSGQFGPVVLGLAVFLAAAALLAVRHHQRLAAWYGAVAVLSSVVLYALPQAGSIVQRSPGEFWRHWSWARVDGNKPHAPPHAPMYGRRQLRIAPLPFARAR